MHSSVLDWRDGGTGSWDCIRITFLVSNGCLASLALTFRALTSAIPDSSLLNKQPCHFAHGVHIPNPPSKLPS